MSRIVVDFPAPLGPTKPTTSPGSIASVTPSIATVEPNFFVTSWQFRTGVLMIKSVPPASAQGDGKRENQMRA